MPTVSAGTSASVTLTENQTVTISCDPNEKAVVSVTRGADTIFGGQLGGVQTIGPYMPDDVLTVTANRGNVDYTLTAYSVPIGGEVDIANMTAAANAGTAGELAAYRAATGTFKHWGDVTNEAALLALSADNNDTAWRTDTGTYWRCLSVPGSSIGNWRELPTQSQSQAVWESGVSTVDGVVSPAKIAAAILALAPSSGGGGGLQYKSSVTALADRQVAPAGASNKVVGRITIPGSANLHRQIRLTGFHRRTGNTDAITMRIYVVAAGGAFGSATLLTSMSALATAQANAGGIFDFGIFPDGDDTTNLWSISGISGNAFTFASAALATAVTAIDTASDWDILIVGPASAPTTDTYTLHSAVAEVKDPDASAASAAPDPLYVAVGDETTVITTGTGKVTFRNVGAKTLSSLRASLTTASSSGVVTVDVNVGGSSILSTKLTIDATEKTSTTAATPAVISASSFTDDAEVSIDIDGAGTGAAGLKVTFIWA